MKQFLAFLTALVIFITGISLWIPHFDQKLNLGKESLKYLINHDKYACKDAIATSLDENTILFLGSSELGMANAKAHPSAVFNNGNSDFNMMLVGGGHNQSLSHSMFVGALSEDMAVKKVVINLSPQWFTKAHLPHGAFANKFYIDIFVECMKNPKISVKTKQRIIDRTKSLLTTYPDGLKQVTWCEKAYVKKSINPLNKLHIDVTQHFESLKRKNSLIKDHDFAPSKTEKVHYNDINFDNLLQISENQGKEICTNNDYYVYDEYYTTYMEPQMDELKNSSVNESYCDSPEYDDLRLFLQVCKEVDIEPMVISVPVNGLWYDYTGFPQADRQQYYQNIRDITDEYDVKLLDLSEHEYTHYFLRDIMHLGWKGWFYIVQGVHDFYIQSEKQ